MSHDIAIAGSYALHPEPEKLRLLAREVGIELAKQNAAIVVGIENNSDHLPETSLQGFLEAGGKKAIGIFRTRKDADACPYKNIEVIITDTTRGTTWEPKIVLSARALIVIGGRAGTMQEVAIALQAGIPIVVLEGTGGAADLLSNDEFLGFKKNKDFYLAKTPAEAVKIALRH